MGVRLQVPQTHRRVRERARFTLGHLTDAECREALRYMVECWKDPAPVEFAIASVLEAREGGQE